MPPPSITQKFSQALTSMHLYEALLGEWSGEASSIVNGEPVQLFQIHRLVEDQGSLLISTSYRDDQSPPFTRKSSRVICIDPVSKRIVIREYGFHGPLGIPNFQEISEKTESSPATTFVSQLLSANETSTLRREIRIEGGKWSERIIRSNKSGEENPIFKIELQKTR